VEASQSVNYFSLFRGVQEVQRFAAGDVIFNTGDPGEVLYVVKSGTVTLTVGERTVETLETGGMFGEMALVHGGEPRSATAAAATDVELVPVDLPLFRHLVAHTPFFAEAVLRVMADRLRRESGARSA
jgi:CRP/FNR family transcriptional regulator, cyclic AMP receptor protein